MRYTIDPRGACYANGWLVVQRDGTICAQTSGLTTTDMQALLDLRAEWERRNEGLPAGWEWSGKDGACTGRVNGPILKAHYVPAGFVRIEAHEPTEQMWADLPAVAAAVLARAARS